jgi:hypothetical protein
MLKIALSYMSLNQYGEGCRELNDLLARYPNSEPARKGYRWLNRCGGGYGYNPYGYSQYGYSQYEYNAPYYGYDSPYQNYYGDTTLPKNW